MESWRSRIRQGPGRALIAVCMLAGVFAMHGLTGNHDAAMALAHQMPPTAVADRGAAATAVAPVPSHVGSAVPAAVHPMNDAEVVGQAGPSARPLQPRPALTIQTGHGGHLHAIGDVCLAMLAALLLALIAALALRSLTVAHPVELAGTTVRVVADGPSPPWRRPTLSKLCVLRT